MKQLTRKQRRRRERKTADREAELKADETRKPVQIRPEAHALLCEIHDKTHANIGTICTAFVIMGFKHYQKTGDWGAALV
jgi:hypothetical protein